MPWRRYGPIGNSSHVPIILKHQPYRNRQGGAAKRRFMGHNQVGLGDIVLSQKHKWDISHQVMLNGLPCCFNDVPLETDRRHFLYTPTMKPHSDWAASKLWSLGLALRFLKMASEIILKTFERFKMARVQSNSPAFDVSMWQDLFEVVKGLTTNKSQFSLILILKHQPHEWITSPKHQTWTNKSSWSSRYALVALNQQITSI